MRRRFCILLAVAATFLPACHREGREVAEGAPADLSITISLPQAETKAGYADGNVSPTDANGASWSDWDRLVDGQRIYRLSLFLVRLSDNKLVGYRDFYKNSPDYCDDTDLDPAKHYGLNGFCEPDGTLLRADTLYSTCARAHFNYVHPQHGAAEKIRAGSYRLYMVANYAPISGVSAGSGTTKSYTGLDDGSGTGFTTVASGIKSAFNTTTGLADFDATHYPSFFGYKVKAAVESGVEQFVCKQEPQALTNMTEFLVLSGSNQVDAQLVRTYSRIRIVLNNESESENLTLKSFAFHTPLAQNQALLFDPGDDSKYNDAWAGMPVLTSNHAIHKYVGDDNLTITPTEKQKVIFDAYVLESKRGENLYQYDIDVAYPDSPTTALKILDGRPILSTSSLQTAFNNKCTKFLIIDRSRGHGFLFDPADPLDPTSGVGREDNNSARKYLNSNVVFNSDLTLTPVSPNTFDTIDLNDAGLRKFVWSIEKVNAALTDWNLFISNDVTGQYWDNNITLDAAVKLQTATIVSKPYRAEEYTSGGNASGLVFRNMGYNATTDPCYLHRDLYGTKTKNDRVAWVLFALDDGQSARVQERITLQVLDAFTGQPRNLEEFCRNDFITINLFATIHPDGGTLEFKVIPWGQKEGSIIFD